MKTSTIAFFGQRKKRDDVTNWREVGNIIRNSRNGALHAMRSRAADTLEELTDKRLRDECRRIIAEINSELEARYEVSLVKKVIR